MQASEAPLGIGSASRSRPARPSGARPSACSAPTATPPPRSSRSPTPGSVAQTFFRYVPSKESLLLADDLDPLILAAFRAQPPELPPAQAIRRAYETTMAGLSCEQLEFENTWQRLIFSIPELKAALYDEYFRTVSVMAAAIGHRLGRPADDFGVRLFVGAMVGAMMAAYDSAPKTGETV